MDERLRTVLARHDGVLTCADGAAIGLDRVDMQLVVDRGELWRVRRDAYVDARRLQESSADDRQRLSNRAVLRSRRPHDALSHHAAVLEAGVATYRLDPSRVDIASPSVTAVRVRSGVRTHPMGPWPVVSSGTVRLVPLPVAVLQVATTNGVLSSVCSIDNALFQGKCDVRDLELALATLPRYQQPGARAALAQADPESESAGETRTRIILTDLGFHVATQVEMRRDQQFLGRVDALVDGRVVVEFDGLVKYAGPDGPRALVDEKVRESDLTACGLEFARVVWQDLDHPDLIARKVRDALLRAELRGPVSPRLTARKRTTAQRLAG